MKKYVIIKFLSVVLTVAMAVGQPLGASAMDSMSMGHRPMAVGMAAHAVHASGKDCGTVPNTDHVVKSTLCNACCTAAAQVAMLPSMQSFIPIRYAAVQFYRLTDSVAVSQSLPPGVPPPKA